MTSPAIIYYRVASLFCVFDEWKPRVSFQLCKVQCNSFIIINAEFSLSWSLHFQLGFEWLISLSDKTSKNSPPADSTSEKTQEKIRMNFRKAMMLISISDNQSLFGKERTNLIKILSFMLSFFIRFFYRNNKNEIKRCCVRKEKKPRTLWLMLRLEPFFWPHFCVLSLFLLLPAQFISLRTSSIEERSYKLAIHEQSKRRFFFPF